MNEMIERVARVVQANLLLQLRGEGLPDTTDDDCAVAVMIEDANRMIDCEALARAAIAAMREPTETMFEAMLEGGSRNNLRDAWYYGIDAALKEYSTP